MNQPEAMTLEEATRYQLEKMVGVVLYTDLAAHLERDAVFIVSESISLLDCGVAVAMDDVAVVGRWIETGELRKPSKGERSEWPRAVGRRWSAVVVKPFVLVQDPR
jgi:hypothetical protein